MSTGFFLLVILVALLVLEGWAIYTGKATISRTTWKVVFKYPFVAFLMGFLMGHLVWPGEDCIFDVKTRVEIVK